MSNFIIKRLYGGPKWEYLWSTDGTDYSSWEADRPGFKGQLGAVRFTRDEAYRQMLRARRNHAAPTFKVVKLVPRKATEPRSTGSEGATRGTVNGERR